MELRVLGCHGGETPKHRTSAFLIGEHMAIDAGALTSGLDLKAQRALEVVLVSHAHLDHVRDLATIADNRVQMGAPPLVVAGTRPTLSALKKHFFNDVLWPDFTKIPSPKKPTVQFLPLRSMVPTRVRDLWVRPVPVTHTIDCSAFVVSDGRTSIAYSGDTGPTDTLWQVLNRERDLRAVLLEVSFPNDEEKLARASGHHTPRTLAEDVRKYERAKELPILLFHMKPHFQGRVERECAKLRGLNLTVLGLGDQFLL